MTVHPNINEYLADPNSVPADVKGALDAIDAAIELSPNLAIAYSRKGAIYYRMGDPQRAAMYWNIALKIDPEFEEIYDMLDALKDDRIELNSVDN